VAGRGELGPGSNDDLLLKNAAQISLKALAISAAAAAHFLGSVAIPVIAMLAVTVLGIGLDLLEGPGRGSNKVLVMWILWPVVATLDYDRAVVPWLGCQYFYVGWTGILHGLISVLGDAWPLGRADLDALPSKHRYSFLSPLGLNGLGMTGFMMSICVFETFSLLLAMELDAAYLRWRVELARTSLLKSRRDAVLQQQAIVDTVVS